ncbi:MAG TPA: methyltransferase domain-containing protein [Candidatus Anoxymicrobiaceae bacterium]
MIIHKLAYRYLRHGDDECFYRMQAQETVRWLRSTGVEVGQSMRVLDLGCGHGMIGGELSESGCQVVFADESDSLVPEYRNADFRLIDIENEGTDSLGKFDLVISSNVLEHISDPYSLVGSIGSLLNPGGLFYLSWTNALSPWWGHEFSPFHYLGVKRGARIFDWISKRERKHTPFVNLFPYSIGGILRMVKNEPGLEVAAIVPRYYPELAGVMKVPMLREFLAWNCVILLKKAR